MPKQKAHQPQQPRHARRKLRSKPKAIITVVLLLSIVVIALAQWQRVQTPVTPLSLKPEPPAPQTSQTPTLSKEYIYAGGRLIATEDPTAMATPTPTPPVNLALNGVATQSSDYPSPGYTAAQAVNGLITGSDLTHTQLDAQAWWQVDLGNIQFIDTIKLWNRIDCCQDRLSNFYIFVSDVPFASTNLTTTLNQAGVSNYYTAGAAGATLTKSINRSGRYVRVQLSETNYLSLAEVEVLGSANLAANSTATQSSDYPTPGYTADKAVNGNLADVTHTQLESQPWWQIDLGSVQWLNAIKLWNRVDCCQDRLSNFYVFVSHIPFQSNTVTQTLNQAGVASYYTAGQAGASITISLNPNQAGRYVRVQLVGSNFLSLTEVQVWGGPAINKTNVALSANGGVATASSQYNASFPASAAINGDRYNQFQPDNRYNNWHSYGWPPAWLQVDFPTSKTIEEIDVITIQDNYTNPINPTKTTTFTLYGLTAFEVQYWNGTSWVTVPGGSVTGNNKVWRKFTFAPVTTSKVRVSISATADGYSRVMELEAWGVN